MTESHKCMFNFIKAARLFPKSLCKFALPPAMCEDSNCVFSLVFSIINVLCFFLNFYFIILYWFCHTSTWTCHRYTRVPHPEPPSLLPPRTIPLGHDREETGSFVLLGPRSCSPCLYILSSQASTWLASQPEYSLYLYSNIPWLHYLRKPVLTHIVFFSFVFSTTSKCEIIC